MLDLMEAYARALALSSRASDYGLMRDLLKLAESLAIPLSEEERQFAKRRAEAFL